MKQRLTILTEPVGIYYNLKTLGKKKVHSNYFYGGHPAVTRSLIEGLDKVGFTEYNYRPRNEKEIADHVHVLAGVDTLQYAIKLKKLGKIKRLTAGPNIVAFSTDYNNIIASEEVDLYLQPSQWAVNLHIKLQPSLKERCLPWPAGIDIEKYDVQNYTKKKDQVLVYHKDESDQFCYRVCNLLKKHGYRPVIIEYGSYILEDYKRILGESAFAIIISRQESQGIYLSEAWAMDVYTICFEPNYYMWKYDEFMIDIDGDISTCPYLTKKTGTTFQELRELDFILENIEDEIREASPRDWVKSNMTDECCAQDFLRKIGIS